MAWRESEGRDSKPGCEGAASGTSRAGLIKEGGGAPAGPEAKHSLGRSGGGGADDEEEEEEEVEEEEDDDDGDEAEEGARRSCSGSRA